MKRGNTPVAEKKVEGKVNKKSHEIKFNLTPGNLACFKGKSSGVAAKTQIQPKKETKPAKESSNTQKNISLHIQSLSQLPKRKQRSASTMDSGTFHEQVVFMRYDNLDVYIDKCTRQKSKSPSPKSKLFPEDNEPEENQFVSSCLRVITEQTDHTSEPYSISNTPTLTPKSSSPWITPYYENYSSYSGKSTTRNRRSITTEESRAFVIDFKKIQADGRTTIMVKNIPNKYTQEILLEEFSQNHENTFDFFYLPIDKDNQCNVGYAFVNFISTKFISEFYQQFHGKKWKKYNSQKICNLCYARYQGTLELANHFRHSKILQQKDRKLKPLIGLSQACKIREIEKIVKSQRNRE